MHDNPPRPGGLSDDRPVASPEALPFVSCLCPTYRRPRLLANALACYLWQDYPADRRELILLDDAGQFEPQRGPGWELVSIPRRFRSLPEKFNALAGLARGEILVVWEDDDIYLPWHITAHVEALTPECGFSKPSRVRSHVEGAWHEEAAAGRFHASIAFRRAALRAVGGWPLTPRGDFDQQLLSRLAELGPSGDPVARRPPSYVFRWETTGDYHGQDLMRGPDDEGWYQRVAELGSGTPQPLLVPRFDPQTRECFHEWEITGLTTWESPRAADPTREMFSRHSEDADSAATPPGPPGEPEF